MLLSVLTVLLSWLGVEEGVEVKHNTMIFRRNQVLLTMSVC